MSRHHLHRARWFAAGVLTTTAFGLLLGAAQRPEREQRDSASPAPDNPRNAAAARQAPDPIPEDGKLRIICFGAHPDDCELRAAGVAAKWAAQGHHVKFVSVTNGDIGHWQMAGGPLAQRRTAEVAAVSKVSIDAPSVSRWRARP